MKLDKILDQLGALEKNSFIKVVDTIVASKPKNAKQIDDVLKTFDNVLKNAESKSISSIFELVQDEFIDGIKSEFLETSSQLDIVIDILIRDGRNILKMDWFSRLYENEIKNIKTKTTQLMREIEDEKSDISPERKRDYLVYKACLETAFKNDLGNNRDAKITSEELSILVCLAKQLDLSQEEVKLINYSVVPIKKIEIDELINSLKNIGVIFFMKKTNTIFVADEVVASLRRVREKELADKYLKRILKSLREPQINLIARKHNIDRKLTSDEKLHEIIKEGISVHTIFGSAIHKDGTSLNEKKKFFTEFCEKNLNLTGIKGQTLEDKINHLLGYFEQLEKDDKVSISHDGYQKLMIDLGAILPKLNTQLKKEFEFQQENVLDSNFLLDYNLKPQDILETISDEDLSLFCSAREIKLRGDKIQNILDSYKDSKNILLENYVNIAFRDLNRLKEAGIQIKEAELGLKFEELTKSIFENLGFHVDEKLKKKINTNKDMMDILINLDNNEVIIVECKTSKESGYNKLSAVSRQLKAYYDQASKNNLKVVKSLLIAPEFSDEFINECELEFDLNLSLMTAESLLKIAEGFKHANKHTQFPYKLIMRDVLINHERIIKALLK